MLDDLLAAHLFELEDARLGGWTPCTEPASFNANDHDEDALEETVSVEDESDDRFNGSHESDEDILKYEPLELDQVEDTKLCGHCRQAINAVPVAVATLRNTIPNPHPTLLKVKKGGVDHTLGREQGCGLCEILLSNEEFGRKWEQRRSTRVEVTTYVLLLESLLSVGYEDSQSSYEIWLGVLSSGATLKYRLIPPLCTSPWSKRTIRMAKQWLKGCTENHQICKLLQGGQIQRDFRPTRLIDVGAGKSPTPRLCLGSDLPNDISYFTLSHCWGTSPIYKLLMSNLSTLKEGIETDQLPKTFRHAFKVTRDLGGRFIWIDSLCIIQDSVEDWRNESSLMTHVYSHGLCNIAASAAQDGSQGLFFERVPFPIKQIHVRPKHGASTLLITEKDSWIEHLPIHRAPLLERGWVFQEQMLSPRTLHFYKEQIFWHCRKQRFCETFPQGDPGIEYGLKWPRDDLKDWVSPLFSSANGNSRKDFLRTWENCVSLYSEASLTYQTDKFVAILGIAKAMQSVIGDRYVAGIWQSQLSFELFWKVNVPGNDPSKEYVAPSWSWASVNAGVSLWGAPSWVEDDIRIVDCHVDLAGEDPFGQLTGGHIIVEGSIAPLLIKPSKMYTRITTFRASFNIPRFSYKSASDERLQWDNNNADTTISHLQSLYVLGSWRKDGLKGLILGKGYDNKFRRYGVINFSFDLRKARLFWQASKYFRRYAETHDVSPLVCAENGKFLVTIY